MKKLIAGLAFLAAMAFANTAFAQAVAITSGGAITGGTTGDCVLLGETVRINLSNNINGAYECDEALNAIRVATCHIAGSRAASTIACAVTDTDELGEPIYNDASCDGTAGQTFNIVDYRGFIASSRGGTVGAQALGGNCAAGTLTGLSHFGG